MLMPWKYLRMRRQQDRDRPTPKEIKATVPKEPSLNAILQVSQSSESWDCGCSKVLRSQRKKSA